MAEDARKSALIAELARSRAQLTVRTGALRRELDVPARVRRHFDAHRFGWLGGVGLLGFLVAKLPARTKKVLVNTQGKKVRVEDKAIRAGLFVTVLKIAFDLARPALTKWVTQRVADYAMNRSAGPNAR